MLFRSAIPLFLPRFSRGCHAIVAQELRLVYYSYCFGLINLPLAVKKNTRQSVAMDVLYDGVDRPTCCPERLARAEQRLLLPVRHNGAGHLSIELRAPAAYFASVITCATLDKDLAAHLQGLQRFAVDTHQRLLTQLGPPSTFTEAVEDLVQRPNPLSLLDTEFYVGIFTETPSLK